MKKTPSKKTIDQGPAALDLIEEAVHLLRRSPWTIHLAYLAGTAPFVAGLMYFVEDMWHNAFAYRHCAGYSLIMVILYVWMKVWQSIYAVRLKDALSLSRTPINFRGWLKILHRQLAIQPSLFIALPISCLLTIPFGWVYAFYHQVSCYGGNPKLSGKEIIQQSWKQSLRWPRQNHLILLLMFIWAAIIFLNLLSCVLFIPSLFKMLLGIENNFTRIGFWGIFNTTVPIVCLGLTYLFVNPLLKAIYVLRCFYGDAIHTGEDLRLNFKRFGTRASFAVLVAVLGTCFPLSTPGNENPPPPSHSIDHKELDQSISETIQKSEYSWRLPKENLSDEIQEEGFFEKFFGEILEAIKDFVKKILKWLRNILRNLFQNNSPEIDPSGWETSVNLLLYAVLGIVLCLLIIFALRYLKKREKKKSVSATPVALSVDLNKEDILADEKAPDEWRALAQSLLEKGELRLALRAFYLSILSQLAARSWIRIAKFKSNLDYQRELERRAHAFPNLLSAFQENRLVFEKTWYGMHEINPSLMELFIKNDEIIQEQSKPVSKPPIS